tara:strand:- start:1058 stop:1243 length:186 start_codon:yes stop_codon:yes gene_type:complete
MKQSEILRKLKMARKNNVCVTLNLRMVPMQNQNYLTIYNLMARDFNIYRFPLEFIPAKAGT